MSHPEPTSPAPQDRLTQTQEARKPMISRDLLADIRRIPAPWKAALLGSLGAIAVWAVMNSSRGGVSRGTHSAGARLHSSLTQWPHTEGQEPEIPSARMRKAGLLDPDLEPKEIGGGTATQVQVPRNEGQEPKRMYSVRMRKAGLLEG